MDMKSINLLGIIGIIGAIILVVGVFLNWLSIDVPLIGTKNFTGMDIYNNKDGVFDSVNYKYVPLVALICGIISLVLMIVPTVMNTEKFQMINNILGIVALIAALVVVVCGLLFYMQSWTVAGTTFKLTDVYKVGIGFWLVLVGGIITLVGGLMPFIKNKFLN